MTDASRKRLDFSSSGLLTAEDFALEQSYHLESQALRCSALHSWGVAWGLEVTVQADGQSVSVAPGLAVDGGGREILLTRAMTVNLGDQVSPAVYLHLGLTSDYTDYRMFATGAGYCRIDDAPVLSVSSQPPLMNGWIVPLACLTFTPERRLQPPDLSTRRYGGLTVGAVTMGPPAGGAAATMALDSEGQTLVVASPLTDVFGSLSVHGAVGVGQQAPSSVALSVQPGAPQAGVGTISSDGDLLFGSSAFELSSAVAGDRILAPAAPGVGGAIDVANAQSLTVLSVSGQTATVSSAPATALNQAAYAISRGALLRVRSDPLTTALQVSVDGQVGIGGPPGPVDGALLTVRAGDLMIDDQHDLRFVQNGSVKALVSDPGAQHSINFLASQNILEVREGGEIVFDTGATSAGDGPAGLMLAVNQNVGVGVEVPAYRLSVDGEIRLSEGVYFADDSHQVNGVSAIPVGTVISWWSGDQRLGWTGEGFQLCNGSTITDPESPLVGTKTPDLRAVYVRGAVSYDQIGATGGAASHTHGYTLGDHTHPLDHTHAVSGYTTQVLGTAGDHIAGSSVSTDVHVHTIMTTSNTPSPGNTGPPTQAQPGVTDAALNQPPFMILIRAMRIK
ncbi:MAG: hypothetical protein Q7T61_16980 [Caulobacter sp.]|nr:hypothetical protein [Caulobacter sp.]